PLQILLRKLNDYKYQSISMCILILYWLQNDLRLTDNPFFSDLANRQCALAFVFVINPHWFKNNNYQQKPFGIHNQQFLMQS
ncbi:deoxyribodipyrimidine photo-lyase, partial [Pseudoalteromonas sp. S2893]|uniref:deoxyribodipyrimidine photo-lyase n=1 Tax=Pseudoalteromonas sp. S2893 TaxID=579530 RepID=UPI0020164D5A